MLFKRVHKKGDPRKSGGNENNTNSDLADKDWHLFVNEGKVNGNILYDICKKIKNNIDLMPREIAVFTDKTSEINNLLRQDIVI